MTRIQARITLPEAFRAVIEPIRLRWNAEHSDGNPAHLTVVYHDEAPDADLLLARLRAALRHQAPFPLDLGEAARFPGPEPGAYLTVTDPFSSVAKLRARVLGAPFVPRSRFGLHATVLHPRYGERLAEAWPEIERLPALGRFIADEVQIVDAKNHTVHRVRFEGAEPPRA